MHAEDDIEIEIWPENAETVEVFFACQTQWVIDGMSGTYRSLNYPGVAVVLDMLAPNNRRDVFAGIQVMESAALAVLQKRAEQKN